MAFTSDFSPETLRVSIAERVGRLTLNRPTQLNPLGHQCLAELVEAAAWFNAQPDIRCVIVSGEGRAFSAGADLAAFQGTTGGLPRAAADAGRLMAEAIEGMLAVTIAAIHGHCVGGGLVLVAACDLRVAADNTRFAIPEVDLGLPLGWGGIQRLVREIGPAATRDLVLTCRPFTAAEAQGLGLLNRVVPETDVVACAEDLAVSLANKSRRPLRATLAAVDAAAESLVSTKTAWSDADSLVNALHDDESRAAAAAYLAQRKR